jgi:hypothetical protein
MYIILLHEGLAVHPKLFRGPPVDRDERLAQGWPKGRWVCVCPFPKTSGTEYVLETWKRM